MGAYGCNGRFGSAETAGERVADEGFFRQDDYQGYHASDCILDLLDNAIDGARRTIKHGAPKADGRLFDGFRVGLSIAGQAFVVSDNCGGISLNDAVDYAFHFGRRKDAPHDVDHSIGLYGIGMKRAIFKIGRKARVESRPSFDAFVVKVDVDEWEKTMRTGISILSR